MRGGGVSHWPQYSTVCPAHLFQPENHARVCFPVFLKTTPSAQAQAEGLGVVWRSLLCIRREGSGLTMVPTTPALLRWKPPFLGGRERSAGKSGNLVPPRPAPPPRCSEALGPDLPVWVADYAPTPEVD